MLRGKERQETDVYIKCLHLLCQLRERSNAQLITFNNEDIPIYETADLPKVQKELSKYIKDAHVSKSYSLHYMIKVQCSDTYFGEMKKEILPWLNKTETYINKS